MKLINKKTVAKNYRLYIFIYGILSVLFVLEYLQENEEYEECNKVIQAIKEQEDSLSIKLATRIEELDIKDIMKEYEKCNLNSNDLFEHSKYYSEIIIKELQNG